MLILELSYVACVKYGLQETQGVMEKSRCLQLKQTLNKQVKNPGGITHILLCAYMLRLSEFIDWIDKLSNIQ
jgi:hypothetical protein